MTTVSTVEPPLSLKTKVSDTLEQASLERYVTVGGNDVRRRAYVPIMRNELDPEHACRVFEEFVDVCKHGRLHLNTGALKFEYWRQCLQGQARSHWDVIADDLPGTTNVDFDNGIEAWFAKYFEPTALHEQKQYFLNATKAFSMTVKETASRVMQIVRYMYYMPGAPDPALADIYTPTELKMVLYSLMRPTWKIKFDSSGNSITDDNYTWDMLVAYMAAQEREERVRTGRGNTRRGRTGRGHGRGSPSGRGYAGSRRSADSQGGGYSQRYRTSSGGYYGRGYYGNNYGYGYGGNIAYDGGGYQARGMVPAGRGRGGRYPARGYGRGGRGHARGGGLTGRYWAGPAGGGRGPAAHPGRTRGGYAPRRGAAYVAEQGDSGNNTGRDNSSEEEKTENIGGSFDSGPDFPAESEYDQYYEEEIPHGYDPGFDHYGYEEEPMEEYGDY